MPEINIKSRFKQDKIMSHYYSLVSRAYVASTPLVIGIFPCVGETHERHLNILKWTKTDFQRDFHRIDAMDRLAEQNDRFLPEVFFFVFVFFCFCFFFFALRLSSFVYGESK